MKTAMAERQSQAAVLVGANIRQTKAYTAASEANGS